MKYRPRKFDKYRLKIVYYNCYIIIVMKSSITLPLLYLYILGNTNMWCSALYVEEDPVRIAIDQNETFKSPLILAIEFKKPRERREAKTSF